MSSVDIESFILKEILKGSREKIDLDEPLMSTGLIDSMGMLTLVNFLEGDFGVAVGDGEVTLENFETLRRIAGFVDRKRRG